MSWLSKFFGRSPDPLKPPPGTVPATLSLVPGQLSVRVCRHSIPNGAEQIPCWTYVTDGLWKLGQKELIFSLRRRPEEEPQAFPQDPVQFFLQVHRLAQEGRLGRCRRTHVLAQPRGLPGYDRADGIHLRPA